MFQKPLFFLMDAANKRIIVCGEDEVEANDWCGRLGLKLTASVYCGLSQYNLDHLYNDGWERHEARTLLNEMKLV